MNANSGDRRSSSARPLRVAVVEPIGRGGMAHYAFQLCRGLVRVGAAPVMITGAPYELSEVEHPFPRVELFRLWDPKPREVEPRSQMVRGIRRLLRALRWYREWIRLVRFLARERPDVIQLGDIRFATDALPLLLMRNLGIPMFDICHNIEPFRVSGGRAGGFAFPAFGHRLLRAIYTRMNGVFIHFGTNRDRFLETFEIPVDHVLEIPHGNQELIRELGDPAYGADDVRRELGASESQPIVLLFGVLSSYKGIDRLISWMPEVLDAVPGALLVIVGHPLPGFDVTELETLAADMGIAHAVRIVARYVPTPEIHAWFEASSVVALPYRQGYQSGVVHLAQTFGRAVVASEVGGLSESIRDGLTGRVVADDPDGGAFASVLVDLLTHGDRLAAMGAAARQASERDFGWEGVARTLLGAYRRAHRSPTGGFP